MFIQDLIEQRKKYDSYSVPEALYEQIGAKRIDGATIRATIALYPQRIEKTFKISLYVSMSPDTGRIAGETASRSWPWIFFVKLK